jgi:hypothetical protein
MPYSDTHTHPFDDEALHEPSAEKPRATEHGDRGHHIASGILDQVGPNSNERSRLGRALPDKSAVFGVPHWGMWGTEGHFPSWRL